MRPVEASPFWSVARVQDGHSLWPVRTSPAATRQNEQFSAQTRRGCRPRAEHRFLEDPLRGNDRVLKFRYLGLSPVGGLSSGGLRIPSGIVTFGRKTPR